MTNTTRVLPTEALRTYTCSECGGPIVMKNRIAAEAFRRYVATGKVPGLCDECEQEQSHD